MATIKSTTYFADITSIAAINNKTGEAMEVSKRVDGKGFSYMHVATNNETTKTTITAKNVPVGKIMFLKYRLCNGYYPGGHFGVCVYYNRKGENERTCVVGLKDGVPTQNTELQYRHRGWVVGRVNAQGELGRQNLWTSDDVRVDADSITIEIGHKDDLDIAYFMTDNYDANLMPIVKDHGDEYYMHQETEFGVYKENQWRQINSSMNGGVKLFDANLTTYGTSVLPYSPEHPEEPSPVFYTVSFDLNGHGTTAIASKTILGGRKVSKPDDPTAEEFLEFDGWYMDAGCTRVYDFNRPVNGDLVLYAKWAEPLIAQKLRRIAEGEQMVYNAGYKKAIAEDATALEELLEDGTINVFVSGDEGIGDTTKTEVSDITDTLTWTTGYQVDQRDGTFRASGSARYSNLITLNKGETIRVVASAGSNSVALLSRWNEDDTWHSCIHQGAADKSVETVEYTATETEYIRICYNTYFTVNKGGVQFSTELTTHSIVRAECSQINGRTLVDKGTRELVENALGGYITPRMFGAKGDGVTDDTDAIQRAVSAMTDGSTLVFDSGTYLVSLRSDTLSWHVIKAKNLKNVSIIGRGNPIIQLQGNSEYQYEVINIESCENFKIEGLTLRGDRFTHDYSDGSPHECGYGIVLRSNGVLCSGKVIDCDVSDFTGDGVFIGNKSDANCSAVDVTVSGCEIHHCRRQGITVMDSESAIIDNCYIHHIGTYDGITGASPMAGIDSEPGKIHAYSIKILNTKIEETTQYNVVFGSYLCDDGMNYVVDLEITNCEFHGAISVKPTNPVNIRNCSFYDGSYSSGQIDARSLTGKCRFIMCTVDVQRLYMVNADSTEIIDCIFRCDSSNENTNYRSDTYNSYLEGVTIRQWDNKQYFNNFYKDCKIFTFGSFDFVFRNCSFVNLTKAEQFDGNESRIKFYGCVFDTKPFENGTYVNCAFLDGTT